VSNAKCSSNSVAAIAFLCVEMADGWWNAPNMGNIESFSEALTRLAIGDLFKDGWMK
jgi:hypothetical protein